MQRKKNQHAVALRRLRTLKFLGQVAQDPNASHKKNPHAVALGRLGAIVGASKAGIIGSQMLTPSE